jgi:hypothetical protein
MINRFLFIAVYILLLNCEKNNNEKDNINFNIRLDKELIQQLNSEAYDTLIIESGSFVLDAYIWRDFQPISPPNGKPMYSINQLINIDSAKIPSNVDMIKQYVIYKDSIWIADYYYELRPNQPIYKIEKISIGGPKWGPKIFVDVISQIHDSLSDKDYYLKIKNVFVGGRLNNAVHNSGYKPSRQVGTVHTRER